MSIEPRQEAYDDEETLALLASQSVSHNELKKRFDGVTARLLQDQTRHVDERMALNSSLASFRFNDLPSVLEMSCQDAAEPVEKFAALESDEGKAHCEVITSLLGVSEQDAVSLTLRVFSSLTLKPDMVASLLGTTKLVLRVTEQYHRERIARVALISECLRHEMDTESFASDQVTQFLDSLDERSMTNGKPRGLLSMLMSTAGQALEPVPDSKLRQVKSRLKLGSSLKSAEWVQFMDTMRNIQREFVQLEQTEALQALILLLYRRTYETTRSDFAALLLAFGPSRNFTDDYSTPQQSHLIVIALLVSLSHQPLRNDVHPLLENSYNGLVDEMGALVSILKKSSENMATNNGSNPLLLVFLGLGLALKENAGEEPLTNLCNELIDLAERGNVFDAMYGVFDLAFEHSANLIHASIGLEFIDTVIRVLNTSVLGDKSKSKMENQSVFCDFVSRLMCNRILLCRQFWASWDAFVDGSKSQWTGLCLLMDSAFKVADAESRISTGYRNRNDFLIAVTPYFSLLSSLLYSDVTVRNALAKMAPSSMLRRSVKHVVDILASGRVSSGCQAFLLSLKRFSLHAGEEKTRVEVTIAVAGDESKSIFAELLSVAVRSPDQMVSATCVEVVANLLVQGNVKDLLRCLKQLQQIGSFSSLCSQSYSVADAIGKLLSGLISAQASNNLIESWPLHVLTEAVLELSKCRMAVDMQAMKLQHPDMECIRKVLSLCLHVKETTMAVDSQEAALLCRRRVLDTIACHPSLLENIFSHATAPALLAIARVVHQEILIVPDKSDKSDMVGDLVHIALRNPSCLLFDMGDLHAKGWLETEDPSCVVDSSIEAFHLLQECLKESTTVESLFLEAYMRRLGGSLPGCPFSLSGSFSATVDMMMLIDIRLISPFISYFVLERSSEKEKEMSLAALKCTLHSMKAGLEQQLCKRLVVEALTIHPLDKKEVSTLSIVELCSTLLALEDDAMPDGEPDGLKSFIECVYVTVGNVLNKLEKLSKTNGLDDEELVHGIHLSAKALKLIGLRSKKYKEPLTKDELRDFIFSVPRCLLGSQLENPRVSSVYMSLLAELCSIVSQVAESSDCQELSIPMEAVFEVDLSALTSYSKIVFDLQSCPEWEVSSDILTLQPEQREHDTLSGDTKVTLLSRWCSMLEVVVLLETKHWRGHTKDRSVLSLSLFEQAILAFRRTLESIEAIPKRPALLHPAISSLSSLVLRFALSVSLDKDGDHKVLQTILDCCEKLIKVPQHEIYTKALLQLLTCVHILTNQQQHWHDSTCYICCEVLREMTKKVRQDTDSLDCVSLCLCILELLVMKEYPKRDVRGSLSILDESQVFSSLFRLYGDNGPQVVFLDSSRITEGILNLISVILSEHSYQSMRVIVDAGVENLLRSPLAARLDGVWTSIMAFLTSLLCATESLGSSDIASRAHQMTTDFVRLNEESLLGTFSTIGKMSSDGKVPELRLPQLIRARSAMDLLNRLTVHRNMQVTCSNFYEKGNKLAMHLVSSMGCFLGASAIARSLFHTIELLESTDDMAIEHSSSLSDLGPSYLVSAIGVPNASYEAVKCAHRINQAVKAVGEDQTANQDLFPERWNPAHRPRAASDPQSLESRKKKSREKVTNKLALRFEYEVACLLSTSLSLIWRFHPSQRAFVSPRRGHSLSNYPSIRSGRMVTLQENETITGTNVRYAKVLSIDTINRRCRVKFLNEVEAEVGETQITGVEDESKKRSLFLVSPAPRYIADLHSTPSTGHLILLLRWCSQFTDELQGLEFGSVELVRRLAEITSCVLASEIVTQADNAIESQLARQLVELFGEGKELRGLGAVFSEFGAEGRMKSVVCTTFWEGMRAKLGEILRTNPSHASTPKRNPLVSIITQPGRTLFS